MEDAPRGDRRGDALALRIAPGIADDERDAHQIVVCHQRVTHKVVMIQPLAVIRGDDNQRVVAHFRFVQMSEEPAQQMILIGHLGVIQIIDDPVLQLS